MATARINQKLLKFDLSATRKQSTWMSRRPRTLAKIGSPECGVLGHRSSLIASAFRFRADQALLVHWAGMLQGAAWLAPSRLLGDEALGPWTLPVELHPSLFRWPASPGTNPQPSSFRVVIRSELRATVGRLRHRTILAR